MPLDLSTKGRKKMKRSSWIAIALLLVIAMVLTQCGPAEAPAEDAAEAEKE